jgi:hypothetical protein
LAKGDVRALRSRRKEPDRAAIAERVRKHCECDTPPSAEGAQPLNPGFFMLERMRQRNQDTKSRSAKRGKLRGK